jgi:hypothetical protein
MLLRSTCNETERLFRTFCRLTLIRVGMLGEPAPLVPLEPLLLVAPVLVLLAEPLVEVPVGVDLTLPPPLESVVQAAAPVISAVARTSFQERIRLSP